MPKNSNTNSIHAQRFKSIRKFVNFNVDLRKPISNYNKKKIKKYYDEINLLTARPYQLYKPKNADRLKQAQQLGQHSEYMPQLKYAIVPTNGEDKVRIRFDKKGKIYASTKYVTTRIIELDIDQLLIDPEKHVREEIQNVKSNSYTVLAGAFEIPVALDKKTLPNYVAKLTAKYGEENGLKPEDNHFFGNWLHSVQAHEFHNQGEFADYLKKKQANKKQMQRTRRAKKQKEYRAKIKREVEKQINKKLRK